MRKWRIMQKQVIEDNFKSKREAELWASHNLKEDEDQSRYAEEDKINSD